RDEAARTYIRTFSELSDADLRDILGELADTVRETLVAQGVPAAEQAVTFQVDVRYHGQGFEIPIDVDQEVLDREGALDALRKAFDHEHERLFSFLLSNEHELVNARAAATGPRPVVEAAVLPDGDGDPSRAET